MDEKDFIENVDEDEYDISASASAAAVDAGIGGEGTGAAAPSTARPTRRKAPRGPGRTNRLRRSAVAGHPSVRPVELLPHVQVRRTMMRGLPSGVTFGREVYDFVNHGLIEFLLFVFSEAVELAEESNAFQITSDHFLKALARLGFDHYVPHLRPLMDKLVGSREQQPSGNRARRRAGAERQSLQEDATVHRDSEIQQRVPRQISNGNMEVADADDDDMEDEDGMDSASVEDDEFDESTVGATGEQGLGLVPEARFAFGMEQIELPELGIFVQVQQRNALAAGASSSSSSSSASASAPHPDPARQSQQS